MIRAIAIHPESFNRKTLEHSSSSLTQLLYRLTDRPVCLFDMAGESIKSSNSLIKKLDINTKSMVQDRLKNLENNRKIIKTPLMSKKVPKTPKNWVEELVLLHKELEFSLMVAPQNVLDDHADIISPINSISIEESFKHGIFDESKTTNVGYVNSSNFQSVIEGLSSIAKKIQIIDPYISHNLLDHSKDGQFDEFLTMVSEFKSKYNRMIEIEILEIHSSTKDQDQYRKNKNSNREYIIEKFQNIFKKINSEDLQIEVFIWSKQDNLDKPHDRYLITDRAGLGIQSGTDMSRKTKTSWNHIDYSETEKILQDYNENTSDFNLVDKFEVL